MVPTVTDVQPKTIENAKRQFVELYGSAIVLNTYLKIALVLSLLLAGGLLALNFRIEATAASVKPLVIRIDDVGRAEAVSYDAAAYRPQVPELRYFLTRFVATHFARLRATIQRDYPDSLLFLDPSLADSAIAQNEQAHTMETFLASTSGEEIDIDVKNVTFSELSKPPYRASIDFEKRFFAPGTRQERRRQTYTAQVTFVMRDAVPNAFIRVNPLGLQITYVRVDQAFE